MSRIPVERYGELFSEKNTNKFNAMDYIHRFTSPLLALLFSELFWPNFIEIDGMVFLEGTFEDDSDLRRLKKAEARYGNNRVKIEASFNTIEVPFIFGSRMGDTTDEEDIILAQTLASMWRARLTEKFPCRKFKVRVASSEETGGEIAVVFYQINDADGG